MQSETEDEEDKLIAEFLLTLGKMNSVLTCLESG